MPQKNISSNIIHVVSVTESQAEIWTSCLLGGNDANCSYIESASIRFTGEFQLFAMQSALKEVFNRHDALRSTFSPDGNEIFISDDANVPLFYERISDQTADEQKISISNYTRQNALEAFDLINGPLFRTALFELSENEHHLIITAHHIICDGWSMAVIIQDLSKYYTNYVNDSVAEIESPHTFSDYSVDQKQFSETTEYKEIEQYWLSQYQTIPVLDMPTDFIRSSKRTYKSQRDDFLLKPELIAAVKKAGAKSGCTLMTTFISAFEVFLHRLTGQTDIVLGIPTAGQSISGQYNLVGQCVNLLPLRSFPEADLSFAEYLKKRKTQILNDYDHQRITFGSLLKKLNVGRDASRIPLIPVVFNIDLGLMDEIHFEGLDHQLTYTPREYESFEISINISGSEQRMVVEWSYNTQLFKSSTIGKWMQAFEYMLQAIAENPALKIKDTPLFSTEIFREQLDSWNATGFDYPKDKTVHQLISDTATKFSSKTAVRYKSHQLSYKELNEKSNQIAWFLLDQGVKPNDIVGVALDRSLEMIVVLIAILKSGAAYLPLDPLNPRERNKFILKDASAKILFTSNKYAKDLKFGVNELIIENVFKKSPAFPAYDLGLNISSDRLAYILYTSGSTGNPKGVMVEHRNLVNLLCSMQKFPGITSKDKLLAVITITFDMAGFELFLPLISGAELILAGNDDIKDGRVLLEKLAKEKITILQATPASFKLLLESGWEERLDLKVLTGGEALAKSLAEKLLTRCKSLYNMYGPTETTIYSTGTEVLSTNEVVTIGRPIGNTQIYILDNYGKLLPEGMNGEIYIGGDGVSRGYLNRPELELEKFVPDPFSKIPGRKMYRTGDVGKYLQNGEIQYLGRNDDQIKIRGYRIEPGEIEYKINGLKGIKDSLVIVRKDNNGEPRLSAYIVVSGGNEPEDKIIEQCRGLLQNSLPGYMVPNEFAILSQFSLTSSGKIDRKLLPSIKVAEKTSIQEPIEEMDKMIAKIWSNALGIEVIDINDDFFALGGHSLIAAQVMNELEKETGRRLPITALFEAPTIKKLGELLLQNEKKNSWRSLVPIKPVGNKPPLYIVHGSGLTVLIFHALAFGLNPEQPVFGLQARGLNGIDDPLDNIEDIAAYYISEIIEQDPTGPYSLAGYSFGGIVAFEMAKQLKAKGKQINMLAIFDTFVDNSPHTNNSWIKSKFKRLKYQFLNIRYNLQLLKKNPSDAINYRIVNKRYKFMRMLEKAGIIEELPGQEKYLKHSDKINRKHDFAFEKYELTPYEGFIDLFQVKKRMYYVEDPVYMGWKTLAGGGLKVHEIPGDHVTFLTAPHVQEFSKILNTIIEQRNNSKSVRNDYRNTSFRLLATEQLKAGFK